MSELSQELARLLRKEATQLDTLRAEMKTERSAFVALRASEIESSVQRLTELAEKSRSLEPTNWEDWTP